TRYKLSLSFIRWGLLFMVISAIGPFGLGAIMAKGLSGTPLYNLSIYFYLHFQYNGWFTFAVLGLFFLCLEKNNIAIDNKNARTFLWLMVISCIAGFALSVLWTKPADWIYAVGYVTVILQLAAAFFLYKILKRNHEDLLLLFSRP